jgi:prepilin signal peptidase PulO-like enzyme (type II secretory pathway)
MRVITLIAFLSLFFDVGSFTLHVPDVWDVLMGLGLFSFFTLLFVVTQGRGVGFGDAKLSLAIGWLLGFPSALYAFMLAFWIGAIVGVLLLFISSRSERKKKQYLVASETIVLSASSPRVGKEADVSYLRRVYLAHMATPLWHGKSEVPFAPFLALGTALAYFFHAYIIDVANYFNVAIF